MAQHNDVLSKVPKAYESALKSGDLFYFPSTIAKHNELDIEFEITLCPALQHKPDLPTPHFDVQADAFSAPKKKLDPFAPPYNPQLHVADLKDEETQEEFVILLNKYSVVPHHFLLVTKEFRSQASPLLPSELVHTYLLLLAAHKAGSNFFAFYNCGDNSGASQAHKHIQFLPAETSSGPPIEALARRVKLETADRPFSLTSLPYASHTFRLPTHLETFLPDQLERLLADAFLQLLDLSISTIRHDPEYPSGRPSYNVIITLEHMHIVPRKFETHLLGKSGERLSVNALGFAGMLLVKSDQELEDVKEETVGKILRGVAVESVHDLQVEGTCSEPPLTGML